MLLGNVVMLFASPIRIDIDKNNTTLSGQDESNLIKNEENSTIVKLEFDKNNTNISGEDESYLINILINVWIIIYEIAV